jgi:cytochrome P450
MRNTDLQFAVVGVPKTTIEDGSRGVPAKEGDTIFADFVAAGTDSAKFPDPLKVKLDRPDEYYIHHGWGPHSCLGRPIVTTAVASMLRVFARLGNLRRAPGAAGEMKNKVVGGAFKVFLLPDGSDWGSFPCSKSLRLKEF